MNHRDGPMIWLGEKIVQKMNEAGWPSRIFQGYRSPELQQQYKDKGTSKAGPWQSPHQFYEAVDIIHQTKAWDVPQDYWDTLASVVRVVEQEYAIDLEHGYDWGWDSAHIEIKDWRNVRDRQKASGGYHVPSELERAARFKEKLPAVWASFSS